MCAVNSQFFLADPLKLRHIQWEASVTCRQSSGRSTDVSVWALSCRRLHVVPAVCFVIVVPVSGQVKWRISPDTTGLPAPPPCFTNQVRSRTSFARHSVWRIFVSSNPQKLVCVIPSPWLMPRRIIKFLGLHSPFLFTWPYIYVPFQTLSNVKGFL